MQAMGLKKPPDASLLSDVGKPPNCQLVTKTADGIGVPTPSWHGTANKTGGCDQSQATRSIV